MAKIAEVQEVSLSVLVPYKHNAKIHGRDQIEKLKASIQEFGFLTPCLIDRDFNIICGRQALWGNRRVCRFVYPGSRRF